MAYRSVVEGGGRVGKAAELEKGRSVRLAFGLLKLSVDWSGVSDSVIITYYSLFHQILGVAFFQFTRSLFENFQQIFSRIIFSSSPSIPENLVDFLRVLSKLDHLACNKFSKSHLSTFYNIITVKQEFYYMPNGLTYKIHNKIPQNFQRC